MHVKKNDKVIILAGKENQQTGEIIEVDVKNSRVKVARRNMVTKHKKPSPITGEAGARIEKENWIHASNVALYSEKKQGAVRTSARYKGQGDALFLTRKEAEASFGDNIPSRIKKVRYSAKTDEIFD